ncbi:rRNA maturation RNase YbeY [Aristophania vespae]|uniref:Endoribonuclease YbeY n=1 Tax=Aristophania vespae TaxID=2697033 RepID=A0A6P1NDU2_9PROT|nr:rRNA maturation RNase YbeY [Aristophania vespae]QHI95623.1 rRNA maturation RNase YbeY [Aristophania vespae]
MALQSPQQRVNLLVEDKRWHRAVPQLELLVSRAFNTTQRFLGKETNITYPNLVFSNDRQIKKLNAHFRGRNKPTNVLTFDPTYPGEGGDIILAYETMKRESTESQRSMKSHTAHLTVHGLLHLAGHDHYHPGEARAMETLETRILCAMHFADPWKQGRRLNR